MPDDFLVLTHALPRADALVEQLRAKGRLSVSLGLQRINPLQSGAKGIQKLWCPTPNAEFAKTFLEPVASQLDVVVLVSPNAAELFGTALASLLSPQSLGTTATDPARFDQPAGPVILCVGQGTRAYLPEAVTSLMIGPLCCPIMVADRPDADGVLAVLNRLANMKASHDSKLSRRSEPFHWLVVRGRAGRDDWIEERRSQGDLVRVIALYEVEDLSVAKPVQDRLIEMFGRAGRLTWVVASTTLAERLHEWVTTTERLSPGFASWAKKQKSLAIHPKIVSKLESNGFVAPKLIGAGVEGILGGLE